MTSATTRSFRGIRKGTAITAEGQATVARIFEASREVLSRANAGEFSMRNIATRAGLRLANVQYYFKTREDLVLALINDTGERYQKAYDKLRAKTADDPGKRFRAIVRFNLEDSFNPKTRALFIQFWALLNNLDGHAGNLLGKLYAINIGQLREALSAIFPNVSTQELTTRATLVAGLTEGLMVAAAPTSEAETQRLLDRAFKLAISVSGVSAVDD